MKIYKMPLIISRRKGNEEGEKKIEDDKNINCLENDGSLVLVG